MKQRFQPLFYNKRLQIKTKKENDYTIYDEFYIIR